ncbi:MAG: PQQ-binding-like beta-propeller repeat protein [Acidimicrobiales bacterium]
MRLVVLSTLLVAVVSLVTVFVVGRGGASASRARPPSEPLGVGADAVKTQLLTTFLANFGRTSYESDSALTTTDVAFLKQQWAINGKSAISAEPAVYENVVYWGNWGGYETATNASTGKQLWQDYLGRTVGQPHHNCQPDRVGVASSASVAKVDGALRIIVGTGAGGVASIDASNGKIEWDTRIAPKIGGFVWSSPTVFDGSVYIGVASLGDCPLVPGKMVKLNAKTGAIEHEFTSAVPKNCSGDTMWSSPAIDVHLKALFITTGNSNTSRGKNCYTKDNDAILKLSATTLALESRWRIPRGLEFLDADFGASPTLFNAHIGRRTVALVGATSKDGVFYALRRDDFAAGPVWTLRVSIKGDCPNCGAGSIASAAYDGSSLYLAGGQTTIRGKHCEGSLRSVDPSNGKEIWADCLFDPVLAAPTVVHGVVFVVYGPELNAIDTADGTKLFKYFDPVEKADLWGTVTVSGSWIYFGGMDNRLRSFSIVD